ncbi:MAG: DUF7305 domain-containing protein [Verrucomicrobiia bacterium]
MKIYFNNNSGKRGSVLALTIIIAGIIGFSLASYLTLVSAQNRSVIRSQAWNATMPLIEAGIEEALAHLNKNGLTNLFSDGWSYESGFAVKRRTLGEGRYVVVITPKTRPVIESDGFVPMPIFYGPASGTIDTIFGQITWPFWGPKRSELRRAVKVTVSGGALFAKGIVTKGKIDFNGNNVTTDSFDSADPNFSVLGRYSPQKRKDNGDVATNSGEQNMFNAGNANILGYVATGPGGSISIGPNGVVGSLAWFQNGNTGIEPGHFSDDMNMSFPSIEIPFTGGYTPSGGTVVETNIQYQYSTVTSTEYPTDPTATGIITNYGLVTTTNYPAIPPIEGVTTNWVTITVTDFPDPLPPGPITTNITKITTYKYPGKRPNVTINYINTNTVYYPTNVDVYGTITTNTVKSSVKCILNPMPSKNSPPPTDDSAYGYIPAPGTYLGTFTYDYSNSQKAWFRYYNAIQSYSYTVKVYTYPAETYSYGIPSYTYKIPISYTYLQRSGTNITTISTRYDYILDSYDYVLNNLSGSIYVRGNARLLVKDSIQITGQGGIVIGPNGSLKLYMAGANTKIAGNGVVNKNGNSLNFQYYGLDSNTSVDISGNGQFTGVLYAPNASVFLRGGGNNAEDFIGSIVCNDITMNGHFNFHYDENLSRVGPKSRYILSSWNEIAFDKSIIYILGLYKSGSDK